MGNCFSCHRASAQKSDIDITSEVKKEPNGNTWMKKVDSDLSKLATPDVTEKRLKHLYSLSGEGENVNTTAGEKSLRHPDSLPSKKQSVIRISRGGENLNASAGELDARSTLSSFFDQSSDDLSPEVSKTIENAEIERQENRDEAVPSSAALETKQNIQDLDLIREGATKHVTSAHSIEIANCDDIAASSCDLDEASRLLHEIDTMTADGNTSAQSGFGQVKTTSNKVEESDMDKPHAKVSAVSLFDKEESKLIEDILREDQQRVMMDAATEDEIELTADLCLLGTSIKKEPNGQPDAELPVDGQKEIGGNSVSEASEEEPFSSVRDRADMRRKLVRVDDATAFYDEEESKLIEDILREDEHRVGEMDAAAEAEIEITADLCLVGTSIKKDLNSRLDAELPDDADDADVLTEVGGNSVSDAIDERAFTSVMDRTDMGRKEVRVDDASILYDEQESKLIEDILREDEHRVQMDVAAEAEIEITADLCLVGTSIKKDPNSRPDAELPDDADDADVLTEVGGNSVSDAINEGAFTSMMDITDMGRKEVRDDATILYDEEESKLIEDILREDEHRVEMDAAAEDEIEITADLCLVGTSIKKEPGSRPQVPDNNAQTDTDESLDELKDVEDLLSINSLSEVDMESPFQRPKSRTGFHATGNNNSLTVGTSEEAAFASELDEANQLIKHLDAISSEKTRSHLRKRQDSLSRRDSQRTKHDDVKGSVVVKANVGDSIVTRYDDGELKMMDEIMAAVEDKAVDLTAQLYPIGASNNMSEEADVEDLHEIRPITRQRSLQRPKTGRRRTEDQELGDQQKIADLQEIRPQTRRGRSETTEHSLPRPKTRHGRAEGLEFGGSNQQKKADLQDIRPQTRRGCSETREPRSLLRPKTRRRRTEGKDLDSPDQQKNAHLQNVRPQTRRGRSETEDHCLPRPKTRRGCTECQELDGFEQQEKVDLQEKRPQTRRGRSQTREHSPTRPKTRRGRTEGLPTVTSSVNAHGNSAMVFYDEEESKLMKEILQEEEFRVRNEESFMDEVVASAELSISRTAGKKLKYQEKGQV